MTPRLVPYTWIRHLVPLLSGAAVGLVAWWLSVVALGVYRQTVFHGSGAGLPISAHAEGVWLLAVVSTGVVAGQLLLEGRFDRSPRRQRLVSVGLSSLSAMLLTFVVVGLHEALVMMPFIGRASHTLHLRWHLLPWMLTGGVVGLVLAVARSVPFLLEWLQQRWELRVMPAPPVPQVSHRVRWALHLAGGPLAGMASALTWYIAGLYFGDQFLASAMACWCFGASCGGLMWTVPDRFFQGWVRVLVGARPGYRIPLDPDGSTLGERFMGHFPVGMDLHLPDHDGVDELHVSVLAKDHGVWAARGLSQHGVRVKRPLEWLDLSFDPSLPAPLEAPLRCGDRILTGADAELEFLVLPRERGQA